MYTFRCPPVMAWARVATMTRGARIGENSPAAWQRVGIGRAFILGGTCFRLVSYKVSLSEVTFTLRMGSEARCNGLRRGTAARSAHDRPAAGADRGAWGILGRARGRDNQHGVE